MTAPDPKRVAALHLERQGRSKTAGEVIFKKDRGGDVSQWAYADNPPSERRIPPDFNYSPRNQKPLARILRATLAALGHTLSGYNRFAKVKSAKVSPDGSLGGRGYIQAIPDMRKQYMNCVEALSALADTIYDEINAPHWAVMSRQEDDEQKADVAQLIGDAEQIRNDPQQWAEQEMKEEFGDEEQNTLEKDLEEDLDDWEDWGDRGNERKVETTVPNQTSDPGYVSVKTARMVRLELATERLANRWLAEKEGQN